MFTNQWVEGALRWTESDVIALGPETGLWEFKSSRVDLRHLTEYVCPAASAFWNSGGGALLLGVDSRGRIDGGLPLTIGSQSIRDRIDQALARVQPPGPYDVRVLVREADESAVREGCGVVVLAFDESTAAPHMAHDGKYYVRAGAHTEQAGHFLVEAIRARRGVGRPLLRCLPRLNPYDGMSLDLVVAEVAGYPALDVSVRLDPTPPLLAQYAASPLELSVAVIDRDHSFDMILGTLLGSFEQTLGDGVFDVTLQYHDGLGRSYTDSHRIDVNRNMGPVLGGTPPLVKATRELEWMTTYLSHLVLATREIANRLRALERPEANDLREEG